MEQLLVEHDTWHGLDHVVLGKGLLSFLVRVLQDEVDVVGEEEHERQVGEQHYQVEYLHGCDIEWQGAAQGNCCRRVGVASFNDRYGQAGRISEAR